jgi:osmotically inducible protein OsmC
VGYAACFQSAFLGVAQGRNLDAIGSQITSKVGIGPLDSGGFGLQVSLDVRAPNIPADDARELMLRADQRCPYSNATRGNITVALSRLGLAARRVRCSAFDRGVDAADDATGALFGGVDLAARARKLRDQPSV